MNGKKMLFVATIIAAATLFASAELTPMDWTAGDLVVPRGYSCTVSGASKTNTSLTVSGSFTVDMQGYSTHYNVNGIKSDGSPQNSSIYLAPNPDDDALLYIKKGNMWGRVGNSMYTSLYFGGTNSNDTAGYGRLVLAPSNDDEEFSTLVFQKGFQPKNADDDTIEAVVIDRQSRLMTWRLIQKNPKHIQVTFTNSYGDIGGNAGPRLGGFYNGDMFHLQSGADIVLKGYGFNGGGKSDGICAPIRLATHGGASSTVYKKFFDSSTSNLKGCVRTEGNCDVVLDVGSTGSGVTRAWHYLNATNVIWNHKGRLVIPSAGNYDIGLGVTVDNALPYGSQTGFIEINSYTAYAKKSFIDLLGTTQRINGLKLTGGSCIHNASDNLGSLVFGANGEDSGIYLNGTIDTNVVVRHVGAGTLTISNITTSTLCPFDIQAGTLCVKGSGGTRLTTPKLTLAAGATLEVDGVMLLADELTSSVDPEAHIVLKNGGRFMLEYAGEGRHVIISPTPYQLPSLLVSNGTYAFSGLGTTNHWFKWTFKQQYNGKSFQLSQIIMYDAAGKRTDGGGGTKALPESDIGYDSRGDPWGQGSVITNAEPEIVSVSGDVYDARNMNPMSIWAETQGWKLYEQPPSGYRQRSPSAFFDGVDWSKVEYGDTAPSTSTPSTWKRFIMRMSKTAKRTYSYNMRNGYSSTGCPSHWVLESSPDGYNWQTVDVQNSPIAPPENCKPYNGGTNFVINTGDVPDAGGLAAGTKIQVNAGGTLDFSLVNGGQEISSLAVDCSNAGGTLKNIKFAATGTLDLFNFTGQRLKDYSVPLTVDGASATDNLVGWVITVNGTQALNRLGWSDGKLVILKAGNLLLVR